MLTYLQRQCGARRVGVVGFCWGGVAAHHVMMTYPGLRAGVSVYGKSAWRARRGGSGRPGAGAARPQGLGSAALRGEGRLELSLGPRAPVPALCGRDRPRARGRRG